MLNELDPILHAQLRLSIMSLLISLKEAEFVFLKEKTGASAGNISIQLDKLKTAGYVTVSKTFKNKYPSTVCSITPKGIEAFHKYIQDIKSYLHIS